MGRIGWWLSLKKVNKLQLLKMLAGTKNINMLTWVALNAIIWGEIFFEIHVPLKVLTGIVLTIVSFCLFTYAFQRWPKASSRTKRINNIVFTILFILLSISFRIFILVDALYFIGKFITVDNGYGDMFMLPVLAIPLLILGPLIYWGVLWTVEYASSIVMIKINPDPQLNKKLSGTHFLLVILVCLINVGICIIDTQPVTQDSAQTSLKPAPIEYQGPIENINSNSPFSPTDH